MSVNLFSSPAAGHSDGGGSSPWPLFFLPGWGFDGRVMALAPSPVVCHAPARFLDPAELVEDLAAFLDGQGIAKIRLAGWSMGANLALDFAKAHPARVDSLLLFAMRQSWPEEEIASIRRDLDADPVAFMHSFYRKCFVGDRAAYGRFVESLEDDYLETMDLPLLHRGLDYLLTSPGGEGRVRVNDLHLLHGGRDIIAPVAEMVQIPGARVEIAEKNGHALFLSPDFIWPECGLAARKKTIQARFSKAAATYEDHAEVQKEVAQGLAARLPVSEPGRILEIGCGSGNYTALLAERYPGADILALDFAPGMIEAARSKFVDDARIELRCCDGEEFLASGAEHFDLITSNATLQWFDSPLTAIAGMAGVLNDSGMLLCSLFGPETLGELALGLSEVCGRQVHLPPHGFPTLADLRTALAGKFLELSCTEQLVQRQYGSLRELLQHIRKTGTSGWRLASQPLLTKGRMRELERWFLSQYGGYQVTYQAIAVKGVKR